MFENLSKSLRKALQTLKGHGQITEANISATLKEIRRVLVQADVEYSIAKNLANDVKNDALGKGVLDNVAPGDLFIKIFHDHITKLLGESSSDITISGNPSVILLCGLQGAGKSTLAAKLANHLQKRGKSVLLSACDIYRPGAIDQLKVLASQIEVSIYADYENKNVLDIAKKSIAEAKRLSKHVVIVDTAGRLSVDHDMMEEIKLLKNSLSPSETIFVVDSMIGQSAVTVAQEFNNSVNFDSIILTKLDSDNKGGCALSIVSSVKKPIKFVSTGEKIEDFSIFYPDRMANRILGMGDVVSLVEKAKEIIENQEAQKAESKLKKSKFDFDDLLYQISIMRKLGGIKNVMSMIPGMPTSKLPEQALEDYFEKIKFMIQSMTPLERRNPKILDYARIKRVAKGSGTSEPEILEALNKIKIIQGFIQKSKDSKSVFSLFKDKLGF